MKKRFALLLTVGLVLGACGSPGAGSGDPLGIITAAATKTAAAGTSQVEMTMEMHLMGQTVNMVGTGENDLDAQRSHMTMTMESDSPAFPAMGDIEVVSDGTKVYMKYPMGFPGAPSGSESKPWVMLDASEAGGAFGGMGQPGSGDPTQYLEFLKGVSGGIETVGDEEVRGVTTTHYRAMMDFEKVLDQASGDRKEEMDAFLEQLRSQVGKTEMPIDIWIGADGLMRRMAMDFSTDGGAGDVSMQMKMTIEMFDFGEPVDIQIPPASEVTKVDNFMGTSTDS
jgi:hypothetical protein